MRPTWIIRLAGCFALILVWMGPRFPLPPVADPPIAGYVLLCLGGIVVWGLTKAGQWLSRRWVRRRASARLTVCYFGVLHGFDGGLVGFFVFPAPFWIGGGSDVPRIILCSAMGAIYGLNRGRVLIEDLAEPPQPPFARRCGRAVHQLKIYWRSRGGVDAPRR